MSIVERLFGRKKTPPSGGPSVDAAKDPNLVKVFDEYGREMFISKDVWRKNVLPGAIKAEWNNPENLYNIIVGVLADGFLTDVVDAAKRLHEIDPDPARGACVWGVVLMNSGQFDEAERVFREHTARHGENGFVLTNVAKVQAKRGDDALAQATLWHALELDPNQQNGLEWFVLEQREREGPAGEEAALRRIAALPRSWRARIWLARAALKRSDPNEAIRLYEQALAAANDPVPAELLLSMSGDLGNAGQVQEVLRLALPRFDATHHGLLVGNNLMRALSDLGELQQARAILDQLYGQKRPDWKETLGFWDTELAKLGIERRPVEPTDELRVVLSLIDAPVWLPERSPAHALFADTPTGAIRVCFIGSSATQPVDDGGSTEVRLQLSDAPGRLSRSIPLFLGEQIRFGLGADAIVVVPVVDTGGFVLSGVPWPDDHAIEFVGMLTVPAAYVVTTHIEVGARWQVKLRLLRVADGECLSSLEETFDVSDPERALLALAAKLEATLASAAGVRRAEREQHYDVPRAELFPHYLLRLEQLLAVRSTGVDHALPMPLTGAHEIMDGNISLCLYAPENVTTRILLLQTWRSLRHALPQVAADFDDKLARLAREHPLAGEAQTVAEKLMEPD